jgi:hypothetical protein
MKKHVFFIINLLMVTTFFLPALTEIDTLIGFRGYFKIGSWFPLRVSVENTEAALTGNLEIAVSSSDNYLDDSTELHYRIPLEMSANSKKTYTVNIPGFPTLSKLTIAIRRAGEAEDSLLMQKEIPLQGRGIEDDFLVVLSRATVLDFLYSTEGFNSDGRMEIVYPHPSQLPDEWSAYHSVGILAIHDTNLRQLTAEQLETVVSWVSSGGRIIFIGGRHLFNYMPQQFADILPVTLTGLLPLAESSSLDDFFGEPVAGSEQLLLTASRYKQGRIILEEDGIPLIAAHDIGKGSVYFFAFDFTQPPFTSRRSAEITQSYFHVSSDYRIDIPLKTSQSAFDSTERAALTDIDLKLYPGLHTAALILLPYAAAVILSFFLIKKYKWQKKIFSISLVGIPLLFSVLILVVFSPLLSHDAGVLIRLDSVSGSIENPYNHLSSTIIISGIKQNTVAVDIGVKRQFIPDPDLKVKTEIKNGRLRIRGLSLRPWRGVQLQSFGMAENQLAVSGGTAGSPLSISNRYGTRIEDLMLISGGRLYRLGDLPAGEMMTSHEMFDPDNLIDLTDFSRKTFSGSKPEQQLKHNYVKLRLQGRSAAAAGQQPSPELIGWIREKGSPSGQLAYLRRAVLTVLQKDVPFHKVRAVQ